MLFAGLYATNRFDTAPVLRHWVRKGQNIVLDRYMESNWGYQACRFAAGPERDEVRARRSSGPPACRADGAPVQAVRSLRTFEVEWLGLPPSHRVLLLQLSVEAARAAMASRAVLDEHERDDAYGRRVREAFDWCARTRPGWQTVQCADEHNTRYSREVR
jgi:thymidylate kinase